MTPDRPEHLLVVSDLHLGEGRGVVTGRFSPREDFFFDEEFARFLRHHAAAARGGGFSWHLVVDGDFLEFLEVVEVEGAPAELRPDPRREAYGLDAGERESVFKLERIVAGHPLFFEALAVFLVAGHRLTVVRGNHDAELYYPAVQAALVSALRSRAPAPIADGTIAFSGWFLYEPGLLWIEHGSQYDPLNAFRFVLSPLLPARPGWPAERADDLELPFGSMFVRYLYNHLEAVQPDADNLKPVSAFARWLLGNHPLVALRYAFGRSGRHFLAKLARAWRPLPAGAYDARRREHEDALAALALAHGLPEEKVRALDGARALGVLEAPRGIWKMIRALVAVPGVFLVALALLAMPFLVWPRLARLLSAVEDGDGKAQRARAVEIADTLGVRYVVMGHTHDPDLRPLGGGREYFNLGTWTKVFDEGGRLLRPSVQLTFLVGERRDGGGLRLRLMQWNDASSEARLLKLF